MAAKSKLEALAKERGKDVPALLQEEYARHGQQKEVAKSLGVSPSTIRYALMSHGLEERTQIFYAHYERTEKAVGEE